MFLAQHDVHISLDWPSSLLTMRPPSLALLLLCLSSASAKPDLDNRTAGDLANQTRDENHPLLTLMETRPHMMVLMVKVKVLQPETMIRLLYERVPLNKQPLLQHLDDPVIEYIHLDRSPLSYDLSELPMGKYIVCGEAMVKGNVYQASCFETSIERLDNNTLQTGVKVIIIISIFLVILVIIYAIIYRLCKGRLGKMK